MKKRLSFLGFVILCFSTLQAIQGMEDSSKEEPKERVSGFAPSCEGAIINNQATGHAVRQQNACEKKPPRPACFMDIPDVVLPNILFSLPTGKVFYLLRSTCKRFLHLLSDEAIEKFGFGPMPENAAAYKRFIMGELIYSSPRGGKVRLPIAGLVKPLGDTFILPQYGEEDVSIANRLTISTGYPKKEDSQEANKIKIWFALRFLVEREIKGSARHLQPILEEWDERYPIGMLVTFWRSENNRCYVAYLVNETMDQLSAENLLQKYEEKCKWQGSYMIHLEHVLERFRIHFPKDRRVSKDSGELTKRMVRLAKKAAHAVLRALPS